MYDANALKKELEAQLASKGQELGYAEITSDFTNANVAPLQSPRDDVGGLSVTVTVGSRPIMLKFHTGQMKHSSATGLVAVDILDEANAQVHSGFHSSTAAGESDPFTLERRLSYAQGTIKTFRVRAATSQFGGAGTSTITAGATNPAFLQVVEV